MGFSVKSMHSPLRVSGEQMIDTTPLATLEGLIMQENDMDDRQSLISALGVFRPKASSIAQLPAVLARISPND